MDPRQRDYSAPHLDGVSNPRARILPYPGNDLANTVHSLTRRHGVRDEGSDDDGKRNGEGDDDGLSHSVAIIAAAGLPVYRCSRARLPHGLPTHPNADAATTCCDASQEVLAGLWLSRGPPHVRTKALCERVHWPRGHCERGRLRSPYKSAMGDECKIKAPPLQWRGILGPPASLPAPHRDRLEVGGPRP